MAIRKIPLFDSPMWSWLLGEKLLTRLLIRPALKETSQEQAGVIEADDFEEEDHTLTLLELHCLLQNVHPT